MIDGIPRRRNAYTACGIFHRRNQCGGGVGGRRCVIDGADRHREGTGRDQLVVDIIQVAEITRIDLCIIRIVHQGIGT